MDWNLGVAIPIFNASLAAIQPGNLFSLECGQILDSAGKIIGHYQPALKPTRADLLTSGADGD